VPSLQDADKDVEPYALEILAGVLNGNASARLNQNLVRQSQIAVDVDAAYDMVQRGRQSIFVLDATPSEGKSVAELEAAILNEIEKIKVKKSKNAKATALQSAYYFIDNVIVREYFPTFESYLLANNLSNLMKNDEDLSEDEMAEKNEFEKKYVAIEPCKCGGKDMDKGYSDLTFQKDFIIEEKMTPKQKIETYAVFFGAGKSELTTEATNTIDEVARILKANSGLTLTVVGHADTMETNLSEITPAFKEVDKKRATAVADQLKKLGVSNAITVDFKGIKEESDFVSGDAEEKEIDWAKNRRVQFIIK
jgi:outer membrane protein OmpA-like peptidoglycan-associated protein